MCSSCQEHKNSPPNAPLNPWPWTQVPWNRIHIDFAGPIWDKMLLVIIDSHSRWPEVCILNKTTASMTVTALREIFARNGIPRELVTNNGPHFVSQEFGQFMADNGIRHIRSSPYHPASNGAAERLVQTVKKALLVGSREGVPLERTLATFLLRYRSTPHPVTGVAPSSLFLQRTLRTRLDLLRPDVGAKVRKHQGQQKDCHNRHSTARTFTVGQGVWVRNFRDGPRWVKGVITDCVGPVSYLVRVNGSTLWKRHTDHIQGGTEQVQGEQNWTTLAEPETDQLPSFQSSASSTQDAYDQTQGTPPGTEDNPQPSSPSQDPHHLTKRQVNIQHVIVIPLNDCIEHCKLEQRKLWTSRLRKEECGVCHYYYCCVYVLNAVWTMECVSIVYV